MAHLMVSRLYKPEYAQWIRDGPCSYISHTWALSKYMDFLGPMYLKYAYMELTPTRSIDTSLPAICFQASGFPEQA